MIKSIATLLTDSARQTPERIAVRSGGFDTTFSQLDLLSNRLAGYLKTKGIGPGSHVGLYCINSRQFMTAYFGILKAGATVVPINLLLHPEEVQHLLKDSECTGLIYHEITDKVVTSLQPHLNRIRHYVVIGKSAVDGADAFQRITAEESADPVLEPVTSKSEVAAILYTGGTTGRPKGAMLTHENLQTNVHSVIRALGLDKQVDTFITVLPMFHSFGATVGFLSPVAAGSCVVALPQFAPELTCRTIQKEKATVFLGVPTMYAMMLNLPEKNKFDLSTLRFCISGGAALPVSILERFEQRYGVTIYEGDGPTECSPVTCVNPIGGKRKIGSVGIPIPGVRMKIADEAGKELPPGSIGEVCVRARSVMMGYWKQPEETRRSFFGEWFRTGDMGKMDEDGYFYLVDRRKDMIIVHGLNVYPRQIEEVIYRHPAVAEAAVIGIPDDFHGELPKAFVALKPDQEIEPREIIQLCREHLGKYEIPRRVEILDSLPKSGSGKILKRTLRDMEMEKKKRKEEKT